MAGMEELEIHSKSYLVRWVYVKAEHTISWSIQPHKKSLNLGIFKHPGQLNLSSTAATLSPSYPPTFPSDARSIDSGENVPGPTRTTASPVIDKLRNIGLKLIKWIGKCEADRISQGTYDVPALEGGNYALVIDNTFSKQISKTATLVLLTYSTSTPPQSGHSVRPSQVVSGPHPGGNGQRSSPKLQPLTNGSSESLRRRHSKSCAVSGSQAALPTRVESFNGLTATVHTGVLHKRRRKRHQGWARRFFSLDFTSSTLSYYHDRNSSALRGAIPLKLAVVATNVETREISVDSGPEIWHLRANNATDFASWKAALEKASKQMSEDHLGDSQLRRVPTRHPSQRRVGINLVEDQKWEQIESLVSKVAGSRDAVRRLAKDTDPKYLSPSFLLSDRRGHDHSPNPSLIESHEGESTVRSRDQRSFWRRKQVNQNGTSTNRTTLPPPLAIATASDSSLATERKPRSIASQSADPDEIHEHLMALLRDLDAVVTEFSSLITESKQRRRPSLPIAPSRLSMESDISQEFFDAAEGTESPLLTIQRDTDDEAENAEDVEKGEAKASEDADSLSGSEVDDRDTFMRHGLRLNDSLSLFPTPPKSLNPLPLPLPQVNRRVTVPAPTMLPPSLIGFLRKNVGKDLSAIATPVAANEPLSMLQRAAEGLEYSTLLDMAASATDGLDRLIYVTAFALSSLSSGRVKERAIRKPFNPMLGETFELVLEDRGLRYIAEKVSHRPVQLAYHVDSRNWSLTQSPMPSQKFWGKSVEIITEGKIRLSLHTSGERFSWTTATSFLRNIIAGEKYVEPVGEMAIVNETTGQKCVSSFKPGGMFSGRSEEILAKAFDIHGNELPLGLAGTWTGSLQLTEHGCITSKTIWTVGSLVDQAQKHYGFTTFAASLNEITPIEQGRLPPTDSRFRPDQRALEEGEVDRAEDLKGRLEERQRERRREMEERGETWTPRWFMRVDEQDSEEVLWRLRMGRDNYWDERQKDRGGWSGIVPVFKL